MINELRLSFEEKIYPYLDEIYDPSILWGKIALDVIKNNLIIKNVLEMEWDLREIVEWLSLNRDKILNDNPVLEIGKNSSIAETLCNFYETYDCDDEDMIDRVYGYRCSHGLRFALRGTDIDDVYIGKVGDVFEISSFNSINSWRYQIDLESFFHKLDMEY